MNDNMNKLTEIRFYIEDVERTLDEIKRVLVKQREPRGKNECGYIKRNGETCGKRCMGERCAMHTEAAINRRRECTRRFNNENKEYMREYMRNRRQVVLKN
jgi:hypothetical protein